MNVKPKWMFALVLACVGTTCDGSFVHADGYHLGPRDKVRVRVYDWRPAVSDTHEWKALTGEYTVSAAGALSLPLVGEVPAARLTPSEIATSISERLQAKIGLSQRPEVAVEVIEYRPFYILGQVGKPGEYSFRPELTVLQAISTAGGIRQLDANAVGFERDGLISRGDLRALAAERITLLGRQARLDAELAGSSNIQFPKELVDQGKAPQAARIMREEELLMEARAAALRSQTDAMTQTETLLSREIESLQAKGVTVQRQEGLARKELEAVSSLVAKGLSVSSRQMSLDQTVAQYESNRLDVDLLILRAKQDISKLARDKADLQNRHRTDALAEMAETRAKLAVNTEKMQTAQALTFDSEVRAPAALASITSTQGRPLGFRITRRIDGQLVTRTASEDDLVEPGDTIRVDREDGAPTPISPSVAQSEFQSQSQ